MTGAAIPVSPSWLALREPADAEARSRELVEQLVSVAPRDGVWVIHDLACGSGSMGRWLAPMLPGEQRWVLHDRDGRLLDIAAADPPLRSRDGAPVTLEPRRSDIRHLVPEDLTAASLITASALLDLMAGPELDRLVDLCAGVRCPVLVTLTVTGRIGLQPAERLDAPFAAAFNAHQRRASAAGRLLGPDAVGAAVEAFSRGPVDVILRPSPWRLGAGQQDLAAAWLDGWLSAACEHDPSLRGRREAYASRRLAQLRAGELRVTVDHTDLLVVPR